MRTSIVDDSSLAKEAGLSIMEAPYDRDISFISSSSVETETPSRYFEVRA